jgi:hypothetical protein
MRLVCIAMTLVACARPTAPPAELPEVAAFRAALADNGRHPLRKGLQLDQQAFAVAVARFRDEHRELLASRFRATLDALPAGTMPGADYGVVAETPPADAGSFAESTSFIYALDPDARHVARTAISMFIPVLARDAGMSVADIGTWIGFFASAAPALRRCESSAERVAVCLDYGGLDVLVVTLVPRGSGWGASSVSWRQRGRATR